MAYEDYYETVESAYIAYYQRPADPEGLLFWSQWLDEHQGDLSDMVEAFADSEESEELYGEINGDNIDDVITKIYEAAFNREPDQGGLEYYHDGFLAGDFTPATIMLDILNGAQNEDADTLHNKIESALHLTEAIDPDLDGKDLIISYDADDVEAARAFLQSVSDDAASTKDIGDALTYLEKMKDMLDEKQDSSGSDDHQGSLQMNADSSGGDMTVTQGGNSGAISYYREDNDESGGDDSGDGSSDSQQDDSDTGVDMQGDLHWTFS